MSLIRGKNQDLNEYATYHNQGEVADLVASVFDGISFDYVGFVTDENEKAYLPVKISVTLNKDDIIAENTDNVMYISFVPNNIDFKVEKISEYSRVANSDDVISACNGFVKLMNKTWKNDKQMYLMKVNLNTNEVSLFDTELKRFVRRTDVSLNSGDYKGVSEILLTKDYLRDYLTSELCLLKSYANIIEVVPSSGVNESSENDEDDKEFKSHLNRSKPTKVKFTTEDKRRYRATDILRAGLLALGAYKLGQRSAIKKALKECTTYESALSILECLGINVDESATLPSDNKSIDKIYSMCPAILSSMDDEFCEAYANNMADSDCDKCKDTIGCSMSLRDKVEYAKMKFSESTQVSDIPPAQSDIDLIKPYRDIDDVIDKCQNVMKSYK